MSYDAVGNITRAQMKQGRATAYVWDYNDQQPVAEITGAGGESVAYASFETSESGNWIIGSLSRTNTQAYTGQQSYDLSVGDIHSPTLRPAITYQVSYWTTNSQSLASVGGTVIALRTINGWTLYQHTVTGVSGVTVSGSGLLDDLRLLPLGAQMTTLTYQPLVGIRSKTGPDGRTVFYTYDGLQRLQRVTDELGRILSVNAYHYASQP